MALVRSALSLIIIVYTANQSFAQPKSQNPQIIWEDAQWTVPPTNQSTVANANGIYAFAIKTQGEWFGNAQYTVRGVDEKLAFIGEVPIALNRSAFFLGLVSLDTTIVAITDELQGNESSRVLLAHQLDFKEGVVISTTPLDSSLASVIPVKGNIGKIKEDLEEEIFAFLPQGAVPVTETRFNYWQSPNEAYLLVAHSFWTPAELLISTRLYNAQLDLIYSHEMPVQSGYTHYGFDVGNDGTYYGSSMDAAGNMLIDRYHTEVNTLQIAASSTSRADPIIVAKSKDKALLACMSLVKDEWYGVNLMEIDFQEEEVSEQTFTKLEPEFTKSLKLKSLATNLKDYRLLSVDLNEKEEPFLIFQQRFIQIAGVRLDRFAERRKRTPDFKSIEVLAGPVVLMNFSAGLEFRWQYGLQMNYSGKAEEGFAPLPLRWINLNKAEVDFVFGSTLGSIKDKSGLRLTRLDRYSGVKRKEEVLYPLADGNLWNPYILTLDSRVFVIHRTQWRGKQVKLSALPVN